MKTSREELEQYLLSRCEIVALDANLCQEVIGYMNEKYDVPTGISMDMIARGKFAEQTEQILFYLLDGLLKLKGNRKQLDDYYTEIEIKNYSSSKFKKDKIKFPIQIKCLQVTDDQWIGKADTKFFMKLRAAQLINYNENAQRTLTKVNTKNGEEYYKITLNESAVNSIGTSLEEGSYISTAITLNISDESDADFYYDEDTCTLIIKSLSYFDISDGYHRYIAMCRKNDANPDFNVPWELRIINFSDSKTNHFIYQEDQKTQMSKADSNTMNQRSPVNRAVTRLNEDSSFCLFGEINNAGGKLPKTEFTTLIEEFYFKPFKRIDNENLFVKNVIQSVKNKFNYLDEINDKYLTIKYTYDDLLVIFYVFSHAEVSEEMDKIIAYMTANIDRIDKRKRMLSKGITQTLKNDLQKLYEEAL